MEEGGVCLSRISGAVNEGTWRKMAANLSKNGPALMAAYKEVVDGKSDTNWALFTYEGNSNDIRLAEKGDGGLEEMVEELNSGKVMYAFCRVQDPNSGLPKYVLINWGAHVTINARAEEEDVDPETILQKVAKASGANFNFHKQTEQYREAPRGPVGSVYRKVNAMEEIQQTKRDDFWEQTERDEEVRRQEEIKRAELDRQKLEQERKEMEERQTREREREQRRRELSRSNRTSFIRSREKKRRDRITGALQGPTLEPGCLGLGAAGERLVAGSPRNGDVGPPSSRLSPPAGRSMRGRCNVVWVAVVVGGLGRPNPWTKTLAIGTWNVTSLGGKEEPELVREVERYCTG
ncbi:hypothetical protein L3Q82_002191 [Scortum barcoo]|uniref:Uncharacterized protein n=1 Tax=Scortum barcoo TaxID=214431 RepID=A0ACB8W500_9TELE|nr:hypothetical protein L3Q82_002191 [Scortum barcoo]